MRLRRRAFTLVELLVVIGIIALLISILLPALGKARQQAQTVKCLTQLRQFAVVSELYTSEFRGYLYPSYWYNGGIYLQTVLQRYLPMPIGAQGTNNGGMNQRIWVCPIVSVDLTRQFPMTYGCNRGLHPDERPEGPGGSLMFWKDASGGYWDQPVKRAQIRRTSDLIAMTDASLGAGSVSSTAFKTAGWLYHTNGDDPFMSNILYQNMPFTNPPSGVGYTWTGNNDAVGNYTVRFRHGANNACNAVFQDGHGATFLLNRDGKTSNMLAKNFATYY